MVNTHPDGYFSPTAAQLLAGRAALGLSAQALADEARLGVNTIRRAEAGGAAVLTPANAERLVATFERLGVTFVAPDGEGRPSVKLPPAG
jgi:transcriptional regulator with XRE-family HTH domain